MPPHLCAGYKFEYFGSLYSFARAKSIPPRPMRIPKLRLRPCSVPYSAYLNLSLLHHQTETKQQSRTFRHSHPRGLATFTRPSIPFPMLRLAAKRPTQLHLTRGCAPLPHLSPLAHLTLSLPQPQPQARGLSTSTRALIPPRLQLHPTTKDLVQRSGLQLAGRVAWQAQGRGYVSAGAALAWRGGDGRWFHATGPQRAAPLLLWLAALLKSSATLNAVSTVGRLTLSILPWAWLRERIATRTLKLAAEHPEVVSHPRWATVVDQSARWLGFLRWSVFLLALTPVALIAVTVVASTERTPISGRWRIIMLSPEEEEQIHSDLRGYGWYTSVLKQMTESSPSGTMPRILNPQDWRWRWVEDTLRRLEAGINVLPASSSAAPSAAAARYYSQDHEGPIPPPAKYPLLPRPRLSQLVHSLPPTIESDSAAESHRAQDPQGHAHHLAPHAQLGPPYNILIVEKPECNAFSHGYGPAGAGGIVVYTGFLDEILSHHRELATPPSPLEGVAKPAESGLWTSLFGALTPPPTPRSASPSLTQPTQAQTEELAVVLAHELSHLILCHHLESLSSSLIVTPTLLSMLGDVGRTILFPLTMFFGPFLNDAIANMFQVGHKQVMSRQLECTTKVLEVEADAVSARLLAYAGYDPRCAVRFWESRLGSDDLSYPKPQPKVQTSENNAKKHGFEGKDHPLSEERLVELKAELARWERLMKVAVGPT